AGSADKGLLQLKMKQCTSIYDETILVQNSLSSIIKTANNEMIVSGTNGKIFRFNEKGISPYYSEAADFSCLAHINGEIWAGTWGTGIIVLKNDNYVKTIKDGFYRVPIHAIFQDKKKRIWIGKENGISIGKSSED